jgi:hypothetical protein
MIRIKVRRVGNDGDVTMTVKGHGDVVPCASTCGVITAATEGFAKLADLFPDDISYDAMILKPKPKRAK